MEEFGWKVKVRYFRTPHVVFGFVGGSSPLCWKGCRMTGDHTHILGDCWNTADILGEYFILLYCDITVIFRRLPLNPLYYMMGYILRGLCQDNFDILSVRKMITILVAKSTPYSGTRDKCT